MSNGADYCLPCAQKLFDLYGYRPAGKRQGDITSLEQSHNELE